MKKAIYIIFSTLLGILLSFILHAGIEVLYIRYSEKVNWNSVFGKGLCALPVWLQIGLFIFGAVFGFLLGLFWWRLVYIEKRRWFKKKKE